MSDEEKAEKEPAKVRINVMVDRANRDFLWNYRTYHEGQHGRASHETRINDILTRARTQWVAERDSRERHWKWVRAEEERVVRLSRETRFDDACSKVGLYLSARVRNALVCDYRDWFAYQDLDAAWPHAQDLDTLAFLIETRKELFLRLPNVGRKSLKELETFAAHLRLRRAAEAAKLAASKDVEAMA